MTEFFLSFVGGGIIGTATIIFLFSITPKVEYKKRMRFLLFIGIPFGGLMAVLGVSILPRLLNLWMHSN